jgi:hypothetical protein
MKSLITISFFLLLLVACRKDEKAVPLTPITPIKTLYFGNYQFRVIKENWIGPTYTYDTFNTSGTVSNYAVEDGDSDLCALQEPINEIGQRYTIIFMANNSITPCVDSLDNFVVRYGPHYKHDGYFHDSTKVDFSITRLGGQGGGFNYYVKGVKQ